ncbi:MAG: class I SAM-dependent methyltransferase [Candidatus Aminicenantes bacterium]|nr:class I SAM-dependent methyltransferase [Candidatus Aminicenantes bacterium]
MNKQKNDERSRSEKAHFDSIASKYVKKDISPPSRAARKLRVRQTVSGIDCSGLPDILEVGSGAGYASEYLNGMYKSYTGIDFSKALVDLARSIHKGPDVEFLEADLYKFDPGRKFDLIIIIGVLHHMVDIPLSLLVCKELLKPGGVIVVNEPHDANILVRFVRMFRSKFDRSYSSDQEELNRKELKELFGKTGFSDISLNAQGFFSTPFAEVMMRPAFIFLPLASIFCMFDRIIEKVFGRVLSGLSWNIIVKGSNPESK